MKDKMTWEETIKFIRNKPEHKELVKKAYFEEELSLNIERFRKSNEFLETIALIKKFLPNARTILDIGSGNGVSAISFALHGFDVTCIEPDPSETIGAGAIRKLKNHYNLKNIEIHEAFAEEINFESNSFDVVYARQCMHHAYNLESFLSEASRVLKRGGLFLTVRDHVVFNSNDKEWFLNSHPLQKFYGGENAFTPKEYKKCIKNSRLILKKELKHFESEINYFPQTKEEVEKIKINYQNKIPFFWLIGLLPFVKKVVLDFIMTRKEKSIPGRMYSYIAIKK